MTITAYKNLVQVSDGVFTGAGGLSVDTSLRNIADYANKIAIMIPPCGRLTLTSGTPVTTSDVTAATNVYYTPFNGNVISLFDGTYWPLYTFTERTLALGTLISGRPYDVFLYDNASTLTLEALAWTSTTARATALVLQDGIWCKTGALTRRYMGTFYTTSTTTTEDSGGGTTTQVGGKRFLWNMYNRQVRHIAVKDTTDNWVYSTATIRQANGAAGNKVEYCCGLLENPIEADLLVATDVRTTSGLLSSGVGLNSTTAYSGRMSEVYNFNGQTIVWPAASYYRGFGVLGYNYVSWNELGAAATSSAFYGDDGGGSSSGLTVKVFA